MKKIVYLGYVVSPDEANQDSGASIAGNKMQWNVIKNLALREDVDITCITVTPLAAYPHDKKLFQKYEVKELFPGVTVHRIAYCNFPVIKQFFQIINVYKTAKKIIKKKQADVLFCFNMFPQVGIPMRRLKKRFSKLDTICLLADLPIDDNTNRKGLSSFLRGKMEKSTWKSMRTCDRYIVLNKYVVEKYLPDKPYIVVEGGVDEDDISDYEKENTKKLQHNILFCGALNEYNGILPLIQAMDYLKDIDVSLDIYGSGYLESDVKKAAENNDRIRYWGRVSNDIVIQKQREAWLLINPRIIDNLISKVTFPSKTFEYMLSGTPVLSTRLNGYGPEYQNYMFWLEDTKPKTISDEIKHLYRYTSDEMYFFGNNAREMILASKTWEIQSKKIAEFLEIGEKM